MPKLATLPFAEKAPGHQFYGEDATPSPLRFDMVPALNAQTGSSYTLALTDSYDLVTMDNAAANAVTIPTNAAVDFPVGVIIDVVQKGAGATTVTGDTGVTVNGTSAGSAACPAQYARLRLFQTATDVWVVVGVSTGSAIDKATAADIRAGTADKYITADGIESAAALVTLTDGANISVDWSTFLAAEVTLAGNRTLNNPTNGKPGTWRTIIVKQDGTGSRTLAFGNQYLFPGGSAPTLTTDASAEDVLSILCVTASKFFVFSALDLG